MRLFFLFAAVCLCSCGATRKLSRLDVREISSVTEVTGTFSENRVRVSTNADFPKQCTGPLTQSFANLTTELVPFPNCPAPLIENIDKCSRFLTLEERGGLEEIISTQCKIFNGENFSTSVEALFANFDSTGPLGRTYDPPPTPEETDSLNNLKKSLETLTFHNLSLSKWVSKNGPFVFSEDDLMFFDKLIRVQKCKVDDSELDRIYRAIRTLDDLNQILIDLQTKQKLQAFIDATHQMIDEKIKEYFYP